ncbi:four helix bundle protein [Hippea jasoniae]|uniref:four helix bundle protein n=1 Tax=Hippea jasoniae TaxID=944479 RepID=UPI0018DDD7F6
MSDQIRRSVISIPSNIAEGTNRNTKKEFVQFLYIALGSSAELETQLLITKRLGYVSDIDIELKTISKIRKMINALIKSLKE